MPRRPTRPRAHRATAAQAATVGPLQLRLPDGRSFVVAELDPLPRLAARWRYRVRNRARWRDDVQARQDVEAQAREDLERLGLAGALEAIATAGQVEVSVPFVSEEKGWDARVLPWESFLAAATRKLREGQPLLVVRHLDRGQSPRARGPASALIVVSEPGRLQGLYSFASERRLIQGHLKAKDPQFLDSPTQGELRDRVRAIAPDVIHLTGFDAHQGAALLGLAADEGTARDGVFLADPGGRPALCDAETLAATLTAARRSPRVVTCNAYNTAARVCALIVAGGAAAAVGFEDEINDTVAERFFASFYRAWRLSNFAILEAFDSAWREARANSELGGSGIVLWSAEPLLGPAARAAKASARGASEAELARRLGVEGRQPISLDLHGLDPRNVLDIECKPLPALNYGLLHNGVSPFEAFNLRKLQPGVLRDVRVEVVLGVGPQEFRFREAFDLELPTDDVGPRVQLPLTWDYMRSMRESTRTGLYVELAVGGRVLLSRTYSVMLLPVEEWRDTRRDGRWLPSFVLPRDPAVTTIVDKARQYLRTLTDDPAAGFDGYQSVDPHADDPCEGVDLQVQALWGAIVHECGLGYINPPPTYSASSQRLRSPSQIIEGRAGTCIDLSLLLAGCLEYIEIYPVVFLLKGHAFPGYWRNEEFQREFVSIRRASESQMPARGRRALDPWLVTGEAYDEILSLVRGNRLVPLEAVWLTQFKGFGEASQAGIEDLGDRSEFEAMLDVMRAREAGVTPLPIRGALR